MIDKTEMLIPPFVLNRRLPANYDPADERYFCHELSRTCDGIFFTQCENVDLDVPKGVVSRGWKVYPTSLAAPSLVPSYGLGYLLRAKLKPRERLGGGPYLLAHTSYCEGYGHWMSDTIPRLYTIRDRLPHYQLLLPAHYRARFYLDSLAPFGITESTPIHYESASFRKVTQLAFPSHAGPSFCNVKEDVLTGVRDLYFDHFGISREVPKRRIYVSRAKVARRFVKNDAEVTEVLSRFGFEIVHFQDHSLLEQLKIAAESEIMIGLTGSGLNNMMFMQPGSKVLEFKMEDDFHNLHYFGFSSGLSLPYHYLICKATGPIRFDADFVVDTKKLEHVIRFMTAK